MTPQPFDVLPRSATDSEGEAGRCGVNAWTLPDGRFTVGDIGWLDDDGYLFLADRRVDLISVGGSNIHPAEVEAALVEHADINDVAVFGVPDPEWGEKVKAIVEPIKGTTIDVEELLFLPPNASLASSCQPRSRSWITAPRQVES